MKRKNLLVSMSFASTIAMIIPLSIACGGNEEKNQVSFTFSDDKELMYTVEPYKKDTPSSALDGDIGEDIEWKDWNYGIRYDFKLCNCIIQGDNDAKNWSVKGNIVTPGDGDKTFVFWFDNYTLNIDGDKAEINFSYKSEYAGHRIKPEATGDDSYAFIDAYELWSIKNGKYYINLEIYHNNEKIAQTSEKTYFVNLKPQILSLQSVFDVRNSFDISQNWSGTFPLGAFCLINDETWDLANDKLFSLNVTIDGSVQTDHAWGIDFGNMYYEEFGGYQALVNVQNSVAATLSFGKHQAHIKILRKKDGTSEAINMYDSDQTKDYWSVNVIE